MSQQSTSKVEDMSSELQDVETPVDNIEDRGDINKTTVQSLDAGNASGSSAVRGACIDPCMAELS